MKNGYCQKSLLPNGLCLVSEKIPRVPSTALGIFVAAGSLDEKAGQSGLAHLIEHMAFKGTKKRRALDIAAEMDFLGDQTNAYTSKDFTVYHTRVLKERLPEALDLLWYIFCHSLYEERELEKEKRVIREEILMLEDSPEELIYDRFMEKFWAGEAMGRPVTGSLETVSSFGRRDILDFLRRNYRPPKIVVSCVGGLDHGRLEEFLGAKGSWKAAPGKSGEKGRVKNQAGLWLQHKKLEQLHLLMGFPFPARSDERRMAAGLLNIILGDGCSSRLFQEIREKRGLAYSVYSSYAAFEKIGLLSVYSGGDAGKISETITVVLAETARLAGEKIGAGELERAKEQLKAEIILGGESLDSRASRLAKNEIVFGRQISLAENLKAIKKVTAADISLLAADFLGRGQAGLFLLGPLSLRNQRKVESLWASSSW